MKRFTLPLILASFALVGAGCTRYVNPNSPPDEQARQEAQTMDLIITSLTDDAKDGPVAVHKLTKQHVIGKSPCPDKFQQITISSPTGAASGAGTATTDAKWLHLPDVVELDKPIALEFNCNISDLTPHEEDATVTFEFGDVPPSEESSPTHEFALQDENHVTVKLNVTLGACTSRECPEGFDLQLPPRSAE